MSARQSTEPDLAQKVAFLAAQVDESDRVITHLRDRTVGLNVAVQARDARIAELERENADLRKQTPKAAKTARSGGTQA